MSISSNISRLFPPLTSSFLSSLPLSSLCSHLSPVNCISSSKSSGAAVSSCFQCLSFQFCQLIHHSQYPEWIFGLIKIAGKDVQIRLREICSIHTSNANVNPFEDEEKKANGSIKSSDDSLNSQTPFSCIFADLTASTCCSHFYVSSEWTDILNPYYKKIQQFAVQSKTLAEFLSEFKELLQQILQKSNSHSSQAFNSLSASTSSFVVDLLNELALLGWSHLKYLSNDFRKCLFAYVDSASRTHYFWTQINLPFPHTPPNILSHDLPIDLNPRLIEEWKRGAVRQRLKSWWLSVTSSVEEFQDYFSVLDDLDSHCWILEPQLTSLPVLPDSNDNVTSSKSSLSAFVIPRRYSHCSRRVVLGRSASLHIPISFRSPRSPSDLLFIGAQHVAEPLRQLYHQQCFTWKITSLPRENIERILCMTLPNESAKELEDSKESAMNLEDLNLDCMICCAYNLNGEKPDERCGNEKCAAAFHRACISEWLRSLSDTRESFQHISGKCPLCTAIINVQMA